MQCRSGTILNERAVYDLRSFGDLLNVIAPALQRLPHLLRVGSAIVDARRARPRLAYRNEKGDLERTVFAWDRSLLCLW